MSLLPCESDCECVCVILLNTLPVCGMATFFGLEAALCEGKKYGNTIRPADITAPTMLRTFTWLFMNIKYENNVSTHRNTSENVCLVKKNFVNAFLTVGTNENGDLARAFSNSFLGVTLTTPQGWFQVDQLCDFLTSLLQV